MAASFEGGVEKGGDEVEGGGLVDEAGGKGEHVGIVVLTSEGGDVMIPAEGRAHVGMLVSGDGDSVAGSANQDSTCSNILGDRIG